MDEQPEEELDETVDSLLPLLRADFRSVWFRRSVWSGRILVSRTRYLGQNELCAQILLTILRTADEF